MADNFDMKKFLAENKLGAYSRLKEEKFYSRDYVTQKYGDKAKEIEDNIQDEEDNNPNIWDLYTSLETAEETDEFVKGFIDEGKAAGEKEEKAKLKKEDADTQAEKMMDFLAEYEVIYVYGSDGKCYRKDDEGNYDEVNDYYCRMYAEGKKEPTEEAMNFLAEYEVIYVYGSDGKCYRKDDEGNYDEVNDYYCRMYAEGKKEVEEGTINEYVGSELSLEIGQWVIDNYPQVADVLKAEPFGDGQEIVDLGNAVVGLATAGTLTLGAGLAMFGDSIVNAVKDAASKLKSALSKVGSSKPSTSIAEIYEVMQIDPELMSIAAKIKAKGMNEEKTEEALSMQAANRMNGLISQNDLKNFISSVENMTNDLENDGFEKDEISDYIVSLVKGNIKETKEPTEEAMGGKNPEGDALVLRFLQGVAKKFNYPVSQAAVFVKNTIKSLGY